MAPLSSLWSCFLLAICFLSIPEVFAGPPQRPNTPPAQLPPKGKPGPLIPAIPSASPATAVRPTPTIVPPIKPTEISNKPSAITSKASVPSAPGYIPYAGARIVGTSQLPASLSSLLFPQDPQSTGVPQHSGSLGVNGLPQDKTNGNSPLGTLRAPRYYRYVGDAPGQTNTTTPPSGGFPWGDRKASDANSDSSPPATGAVRSYNFVISRGYLAPDGVELDLLLVNGQYPGPTIEANWGDTIQVTVTNNIVGPEEGTALHWHGLLQQGTPYEDGVAGITQCPIAPGQTFTYSFSADVYGTSFYHSHYGAQNAGGVLGAILIHGPQNALYDEDLGPLILSDYFHADYNTLVRDAMSTDFSKINPYSDNNLINGKGFYDCSSVKDGSYCTPNAGLSKFQFNSGESYRLRLINSGAEATQQFSIDNHTLTVIAYDVVPIVPYTTNVVTLGVGQRADVVVTATGNPNSVVWMRSTMASSCARTHQPNGLGIIYYQNTNTTAEPTSQGWPLDGTQCGGDPLSKTIPYAPITPPQSQTSATIDMNFEINETGNYLFTMDGSTFRTNYNQPILPLAVAGNTSFPEEWNVYNYGSNKSITFVVNNETPMVHPMHIHGHSMYVLNQGSGRWDGTAVNPSNPMRRDVVQVLPSGYVAFQIVANNPGVWPFHCHIAWHASQGMYVNFMTRTDLLPSVQIPSSVSDLCSAWSAFTAKGPIDQFDSGLRRREHQRHSYHKYSNIARRHL
ncbi:hypothetical protein H2200_002607 [Cladophialophora chaetospira]|uniref:Multicopper oxidase n=1 Tax=Cladophialophora chaetospira TaxID=386627 RepID=A0AA38XJ63_9EURO|nr:hypothetical protein H2200_002607 [Cladophialophora chaetospira]